MHVESRILSAKDVCPECGGRKNIASKTCRNCYNSRTGSICADCGGRCKRCEKRCPACRGAAKTNTCPGCGGRKTLRAASCNKCALNGSGETHRAWKGGRVQLKDGYVRVYAPEHPRAVNGRYVMEHIKVMEDVLGRHLHDDERVHHRNKIRDDNRPENLELWSVGHPAGARVEDLLVWAREVIERYGE